MHPFRVWVELSDVKQWYKIIREANTLYGRQWRCQPRVKRKLDSNWNRRAVKIWFDVPDANFATWISVKHGVITRLGPNK